MREFVHKADDGDFEAVVLQEKGRAVLVDFWAEWCPPCLALGKALEALAEEFDDRVKIVKVDVEAAPETAAAFGGRSIPFLVVFRDGKKVGQMVGNPGPVRLRRFLEEEAVG